MMIPSPDRPDAPPDVGKPDRRRPTADEAHRGPALPVFFCAEDRDFVPEGKPGQTGPERGPVHPGCRVVRTGEVLL